MPVLLLVQKVRKTFEHYRRAKNPQTLFAYNFVVIETFHVSNKTFELVLAEDSEALGELAVECSDQGLHGVFEIRYRRGGKYSGFGIACKDFEV